MLLALSLFSLLSLAEIGLWLPVAWKHRRLHAGVLVPLLAWSSGLVVVAHLSLWSILLLVASTYRVLNLIRIVQNRSQADYLFHAARRTSLLLILGQVGLLLVAGSNHTLQLPSSVWLWLTIALQAVGAAILLRTTLRELQTTQPSLVEGGYADRDLPSLTVAIPARNETDDLEACLRSLLGSSYPKLEILVLDDCSQVKRTPEIIRSFAHDGVLFVAGEEPPKQWLAKNYAYEQLAHAANGELLLFCGVDARFEPETLRLLVKTMVQKKKTMLSLIPKNKVPSPTQLENLLVQPARYAWELAIPRRMLQKPPVLSTCWMIQAAVLHDAGGFKAVTHSSSPERYLARYAAIHGDGYSFMQSSALIGLSSAKSIEEQRATATRTRYPQLHRRPELVACVTVLELGLLVAPFGVCIWVLLSAHWLAGVASAVTCLALAIFYSLITRLTYRTFLLRGLWLLPFAVLYDVGLLNYSMQQYEFNEVLWKGRNVCIPIMRVINHLPQA